MFLFKRQKKTPSWNNGTEERQQGRRGNRLLATDLKIPDYRVCKYLHLTRVLQVVHPTHYSLQIKYFAFGDAYLYSTKH